MEQVDYVIGNSHKFSSLLGVIRRGEIQSEPKVLISDIFREKKRKFDTPDIRFFPDRTRAFLKVQGRVQLRLHVLRDSEGREAAPGAWKRMKSSRDSGLSRARVTGKWSLTGVHLASYGRDIGSDLVGLLGKIEESGTVRRIRLSSLDPADTGKELISFVSGSEVVCPSFHVALQSGDRDVPQKNEKKVQPRAVSLSARTPYAAHCRRLRSVRT